MKIFSIAAISLGFATAFISCNQSAKNNTSAEAIAAYVDTVGMDKAVSPGDNFFDYANGNWVKNVKIPDDQSGWGIFYIIYEDNQKKLKTILENAAKSTAAKGSLEQKVGDYYAAGMDTLAIDKKGAEPLKPTLAKIDAIKDHKEMMAFIADAYSRGEGELLGFYVGADDKNSSQHIAVFSQSGCSLPEKDYYTRTDANSVEIRNAFTKFIRSMFTLSGTDSATAAKNATAILALETEISKSHRSPVELRDPQKNYNKRSIAELDKQMPNIGWAGFASKLNVKLDSVNVSQPAYFAALDKMLAAQSIDVWKTKLKFEYISANAALLSKDFRDANFEYGKVFSGAKKQSDRWKTVVNKVDAGLPELLGQLYVKDYFTADAKKRMDELVSNLQKAFEVRINALDWMSDSTKTRAKGKLFTFLKKIGNPDKWKNYDDVTIDKADYFASAQSIQAHDQKEMLGKIGKPVDRTEWGMSAPTVNAYYNPSNNEIVFPAGILQQPFFALGADDAINYGAIGMVIGHEMTHGFDDQGSQYDDQGNLKNWWTAEDGTRFKSKTKVVVDQYAGFKVLDSLHLNGELTQGENIADIGGLAIAYDAFKLTKQGKGTEKIDGFTPDQRFFLGFAQAWREKMRDETARMLVNV
ncbi:MAG: M13 family peptidase, partial [Sphingobacteriales bacterium]